MNPSAQTTPTVKVKSGVGNVVIIDNDIIQLAQTYLSADLPSATSTLPVESAVEFAANNLILIGSLGTQNAELRIINTVSAGTNPTISPTVGTVSTHNKGESLASIQYNQIEISRSATLTGSYSVLATASFQLSQTTTEYQDASGLTTSYYKARFKNSVTSAFSDYSTPVSVSSLTSKTAAGLIIPLKKLI